MESVFTSQSSLSVPSDFRTKQMNTDSSSEPADPDASARRSWSSVPSVEDSSGDPDSEQRSPKVETVWVCPSPWTFITSWRPSACRSFSCTQGQHSEARSETARTTYWTCSRTSQQRGGGFWTPRPDGVQTVDLHESSFSLKVSSRNQDWIHERYTTMSQLHFLWNTNIWTIIWLKSQKSFHAVSWISSVTLSSVSGENISRRNTF